MNNGQVSSKNVLLVECLKRPGVENMAFRTNPFFTGNEFSEKLSKGESLDSDMNVQEPVNVIYQTIISVKSLCFSSIVISTDALAYIILEHEEKNTMTFLSD